MMKNKKKVIILSSIFVILAIAQALVIDHDTTLTDIDALSTNLGFFSYNANHIWNNNSFDYEDTTYFLYMRDTGLAPPNNFASTVGYTKDGITMTAPIDVRQMESIISNTGCYVPNQDAHLVYTRDGTGVSFIDEATSSSIGTWVNPYTSADEGDCDFIANETGDFRACIDPAWATLMFYPENDHSFGIYAPVIVMANAYTAIFYDSIAPTVDINENSSTIVIAASNQSVDQKEELEIHICETANGECDILWNPNTLHIKPDEPVDNPRCDFDDNDCIECIYDNTTDIKYLRYNNTGSVFLNGSLTSSEDFDGDLNTDGGNVSYFPVMNTLDTSGASVWWLYLNWTYDPPMLMEQTVIYRMVNYSEGRRYWAEPEQIIGTNETEQITTGQGLLGSYVAQGLNQSSLTNFQILRDGCIDNDGDGFNVSMRGCGIADCNDTNATWIPLENNTEYSFSGGGETNV